MCGKTPISVFIGSYLSYSETFIYDQLKFQSKFHSQVLAYRENKARSQFPYNHVTILNPAEGLCYYISGNSPTFLRSIESHKSQLLHAHFGTNGAYAAGFARRLHLPLVVSFHGHDAAGLAPENRWALRYFRYHLKAGQMIETTCSFLPASKDLADDLIRKYHVPADKVSVHRLGIDLNQFSYVARPERVPSILMVGRFVEKKGFEYGLLAFAKLFEESRNLRLSIVGSGKFLSKYRRIVKEYNLGNSVSFLGVLNPGELESVMQGHDILLAPSVTAKNGDKESGLLVLKEAAATGMATIGTIHGGIPEIIQHAKTGYLVQEKNVDEMYRYLKILVNDFNLRVELGKKARAFVATHYDARKQNALLEAHFENILAR
ncbi:MAG: glycosyltransferase [Candidatus Aminicenantes bacterium]|nr:glycosyltransferase [Candidatus Aminicenantes bacterium]